MDILWQFKLAFVVFCHDELTKSELLYIVVGAGSGDAHMSHKIKKKDLDLTFFQRIF